jgi:hypothetical protein
MISTGASCRAYLLQNFSNLGLTADEHRFHHPVPGRLHHRLKGVQVLSGRHRHPALNEAYF